MFVDHLISSLLTRRKQEKKHYMFSFYQPLAGKQTPKLVGKDPEEALSFVSLNVGQGNWQGSVPKRCWLPSWLYPMWVQNRKVFLFIFSCFLTPSSFEEVLIKTFILSSCVNYKVYFQYQRVMSTPLWVIYQDSCSCSEAYFTLKILQSSG